MVDVHVSFRYVRCTTADEDEPLEFDRDPAGDGTAILHVPSEARWDAIVPSWAVDRRDDVMAKLRDAIADMRDEVVEY